MVVGSCVVKLCDIFSDVLALWYLFVVEAEIGAEADEGGEIEDEDHEAHEERSAAALARELEISGVESCIDDCVLW